ncbi:HDIG domain-containing protein [Ruminococcaceae bacterium OttesenSCG-928-O06]|nr:HDIG domain-containing protein [Ruminococcaceae bacterium OttesenSCG-928-O06]
MPKLTMQQARALLESTTTQPHLLQHALAVSGAMGAMARHFGQDEAYWQAVGLLHDYDYEQYPEEHLQHTAAPLAAAGVDDEAVRAILSHGWGLCTDVEPQTEMEKSLYAVDEMTGLVSATAKMRPSGIADLAPKSVNKKFKDKAFAAKIDREVIQKGAEMLGMDLAQLTALCIEGMRPHAAELGLLGTGA